MGDGSLITGFYAWGSDISTILQDWEYLGVFEYVLPFLLIFAIIFGILHKSKVIGEHRGINMVIALSIALLAVTSLDLRIFFRILFPYAGVGLAILVVGLILTGLFYNGETADRWWRITFFSIGMVIAVIVVLSALSNYSSWGLGSWWWRDYINAIVVAIVVIGLVALVVLSAKKSGPNPGPTH